MDKLVYHPELLHMVTDMLDSSFDLLALCRVSHQYYHGCIARLYKHLIIDPYWIATLPSENADSLAKAIKANIDSIQTLEVTNDTKLPTSRLLFVSNFLQRLYDMSNLRHVKLGRLCGTIRGSFRWPHDAPLLSVELSPGNLSESWSLCRSTLTSLRLSEYKSGRDIGFDLERLCCMKSLRVLALDSFVLSPDVCKYEFPQLEQLELRLPKSMGCIHLMCTKLQTLLLEGVSQREAIQIISQTNRLVTLQLHLKSPSLFTGELANAIGRSGQSLRHLWLEGSHWLQSSYGVPSQDWTYLRFEERDTWARFACQIPYIEVLAFERPEVQLQGMLELSDLLHPPLKRLRRLILIDGQDIELPGTIEFGLRLKGFLYNHLLDDLFATRDSDQVHYNNHQLREIWLSEWTYNIVLYGGLFEDVRERVSIQARAAEELDERWDDFEWTKKL